MQDPKDPPKDPGGNHKTDQLFTIEQPNLVDFTFNKEVVAVFPDMIRRSVPGYETVLPLSGLLAAEHLPAGGRLYDLGCSQGASTAAVLARIGSRDCQIIGVDNSEPMLSSAAALIKDPRVQWLQADVCELEFEPCNVVLLNYILQFLTPTDRLQLLRRLRSALGAQGCIILSEKVHLDDAETDPWFNELHLAFKRANGYSDLEIAGKRNALENVMIIDTESTHRQRLHEAGFSRIDKWFQCLNWASFIIRP
ncbi:MAG: carboxy-S-adenosyl-L-methionine synthase CmoA [Pseudomonadales bacterium]